MVRVGIFMGGPSLEKEVSFNSGRTIFDYLDRDTYIPIPIFMTPQKQLFILPWQFIYRGKISDFLDRLSKEAQEIMWQDIPKIIDFAYIAMHGYFGEDGNIQGLLTIFGIPFSGSSLMTNAITSNKNIISDLLKYNNILVPAKILKKKNFPIDDDIYNFVQKYHVVVVKPNQEGSSLGVNIVNNEHNLIYAIEEAQNLHKDYSQDVLIQEYISGKEFTVIAIEQNEKWIVLEPTEIAKNYNTIYTYNQKYLPGGIVKYTPSQLPFEIIQQIKEEVKKIINIINGSDIIRIDGIFDFKSQKIFYIDINPFPGMAPNSFVFLQGAQGGFTPTDIINIIISNGLRRNHKQYLLSNKNITYIETNANQKEKKINICVLLGGNSNEKEISLESGRNVYYKLSKKYFNATPIFVSSKNEYYIITLPQIVKDTTKEIEDTLQVDQKIELFQFKDLFDFVFLGLHGGEGENGILQKKLEDLGLPYNGVNSKISKIGMNKSKTLDIFAKNGLHTTSRLLINRNNRYFTREHIFIDNILKKNKKIIIKPNDDGCSTFVTICYNREEVFFKIDTFFKISGKLECLIEGVVEGIELTVGIMGYNKKIICFPITKTVKSENILSLEEKFLPGAGENITPAFYDEKTTHFIQQKITHCFKVLGGYGYARIDCFWNEKKRELIFLEINTLPALTPATCLFHQAAEMGLSPSDFFNYIIYIGFLVHKPTYQLTHSFMENISKIEKILTIYQKTNK